MFNQSLIVGTLLVCSLWTEITIAGSSFLSPEQPKMQRKGLQKPATKFHRRDAEAALEVPGNEVEGTSNEMDIKVTVPFEISMKISEAQYKDCEQILEKFLEDILAGSIKENQAKD
ncbi:appetite-regulating hormone-like [Sceloporus undulatus]|uniref:appetite-regulating hormone-like n=1 Tax=Sceloporus undulatus TaxID=8520 RepID=UPI001C4C7204|nr:appetite-regulating hormone-like [Sceloporus undulatus]